MEKTGTYYYTCATHNDSGEVHCTKSDTGFKELDRPHTYSKFISLCLPKESADRKVGKITSPAVGLLGAFAALHAYATADTVEDKILTSELGTRDYIILNKS